MIQLTEYRGDEPGERVYVNPNEIAVIRAYCRHSFRPLIGEVVLQSGKSIYIWESVAEIESRIKRAAGGGE